MSVFLFLYALCISTAWSLRAAPPYALEDAELHFETFIKRHDKQYADEHEKQARFEIFKVNLEEVNRLNDGQDDAVFGLTWFMDLTNEEFLRGYTGLGQNSTAYRGVCPYASEEDFQNVVAPESFDWRQQNVVTPVKNQFNCAACYAFSALGNIESQYAMRTGQHLDLSEQQIVDCDTTSNACHGGLMQNVFQYLIGAGGAVGERDYPYRDTATGLCQFDSSRVQVRLADCRGYSLTSQESLKQVLVSTGPISIGIQAEGIKKYEGGYIPDELCNVGVVNHAVLLVGYGTHSNGKPIWIVKNSWGTQWGDQGYLYIARGENALSCGMINDQMGSAILA